MSVVLNNDGTLSITAMSLVEFLPEIETAIHNGFQLSLEKNEGVPQQYGSMLVLTMYPAGDVVVSEDTTSVAGEEHETALQEALMDEVTLSTFTAEDEGFSDLEYSPPNQTDEPNEIVDVRPVKEVTPVKLDGRKKKT